MREYNFIEYTIFWLFCICYSSKYWPSDFLVEVEQIKSRIFPYSAHLWCCFKMNPTQICNVLCQYDKAFSIAVGLTTERLPIFYIIIMKQLFLSFYFTFISILKINLEYFYYLHIAWLKFYNCCFYKVYIHINITYSFSFSVFKDKVISVPVSIIKLPLTRSTKICFSNRPIIHYLFC